MSDPVEMFLNLREKLTFEDDAIRALYAHAKEEGRREGMREGYLLGFNASGEGWNGEYPFQDDSLNPEDVPDWIDKREAAILAALEGK